jgi:hypothetical protein
MNQTGVHFMVRALHGIRYARFAKTKKNLAVALLGAKFAPQKRGSRFIAASPVHSN